MKLLSVMLLRNQCGSRVHWRAFSQRDIKTRSLSLTSLCIFLQNRNCWTFTMIGNFYSKFSSNVSTLLVLLARQPGLMKADYFFPASESCVVQRRGVRKYNYKSILQYCALQYCIKDSQQWCLVCVFFLNPQQLLLKKYCYGILNKKRKCFLLRFYEYWGLFFILWQFS